MVQQRKHKVPHSYSGADVSAPSLTEFGMTGLLSSTVSLDHFENGLQDLSSPDGPRVKQRAFLESEPAVNLDGPRVVGADGEKWALAA
jgi:hypothetical protein